MRAEIGRGLVGLVLLLVLGFGLYGLGGLPRSLAEVLRAASVLAALIGTACLFLAAIISVRLPGWDRWFGGLTRLWYLHATLGSAAFLLLLAHPVLLAYSRLEYGSTAAFVTLFPSFSAFGVWAGWLALLAMMIFLAPTYRFFGDIDYQRWKALHWFSLPAVAFGLWHAVALGHSLGHDRWWWGVLGGLALLVVLWRALLARRVQRKPYIVSQRHALAEDVVELTLTPARGSVMPTEPAQFIYLTPLDSSLGAGYNEEHPYTLSSSPGEPHLRVAVKNLGDASGALQSVAEGSRAWVDGPYGDFFPQARRSRAQLWIGGGIGITPFVSMARWLAESDQGMNAVLVYCAENRQRAYFQTELEQLAEASGGQLQLLAHYFEERNALNKAFLDEHCADIQQRDWYICGPSPLIRLSHRLAHQAGVSARNIHSEEFSFV